MRLVTFLVVCLWGIPVALAFGDTSRSYDYENFQSYGNCMVGTTVDMYTDQRAYVLFYGEETLTDETLIGIGDDDGDGHLDIIASKGTMFRLRSTIDVVFRIDTGPLITRTAEWIGSRSAVIRDPVLAASFLDGLAQWARLAIQVGNECEYIQLR